MVKARIEGGDLIDTVDMQNGAGLIYKNTETGGDMADQLHPNANGYAKMAKVWFDAIMTTRVVLPVELMEFKAINSQMEVQLNWSTAMEQDNSHFVVERMLEGQPFAAVGTVAGAGNSSSLLRYSYADANAPTGQLYYRLKQVDEDGTYSYSNIIAVSRAVATKIFTKIYPNPTEGAESVDISATGFAEGCSVDITLRDAMGRNLHHQTVKAGTQGEVTTKVRLPDALDKGMYIWELRGAGRSQQLKLLVR